MFSYYLSIKNVQKQMRIEWYISWNTEKSLEMAHNQ